VTQSARYDRGVAGAVDVVVVGGGIAGGALATVLATAGRSVLVLERSTEYRDRVRGEYMAPWGVADARRLGLLDVLLSAGGNVITRIVPYDETVEPSIAEQASVLLDGLLPDVPGALGIRHPVACEALETASRDAGATVVRGVSALQITVGRQPSVQWSVNGGSSEATCRLIVGADGRESAVRRQTDIPLHANPPRLLGAGLLVEGASDWPTSTFTVGTEDDRLFFIIPLGQGRARLYLMYDVAEDRRLVGAQKASRFLEGFGLRCVPGSEWLSAASPAGPCAVYPMHDSWCDMPFAEGVVLVGDAAGFSDPQLGQGLSVAMRDVRVLSELLLASDDWSPSALTPYGDERSERMRRLRWVNDVVTTLRGEFGPTARERRRRAMARMRENPELAQFRRASLAGPETVPPEAFATSVVERLLAP
jgi:2-polyprenyl-6-methoxyphenol hydroxylase-like FAD-dependent oxidoreductase